MNMKSSNRVQNWIFNLLFGTGAEMLPKVMGPDSEHAYIIEEWIIGFVRIES